jgi:hypothetical protein
MQFFMAFVLLGKLALSIRTVVRTCSTDIHILLLHRSIQILAASLI